MLPSSSGSRPRGGILAYCDFLIRGVLHGGLKIKAMYKKSLRVTEMCEYLNTCARKSLTLCSSWSIMKLFLNNRFNSNTAVQSCLTETQPSGGATCGHVTSLFKSKTAGDNKRRLDYINCLWFPVIV